MEADMKRTAVLQNFFERFMPKVYPVGNVPEDVELPYLTYENRMPGKLEETELTVHLYFYSESEAVPNTKAEEICDALRDGGQLLPCDDGAVWLRTSIPEWYGAQDSTSRVLKHRIINLTRQDL